ncbi:MAG: AAA family ATPase [Candidatus Aenigmarchaeota archaeon]|nr:AAA family ATPase [Candidatus Aenigmarchaeota archaeon]
MITRIRLRNWKSHLESEFEFSSGVNAIIGIMGSGKTSIMQAISFALFGTFPALQTRRVSLDDLIMKKPQDMKEAEVELEFSLGDKKYSVLRALKKEKGTVKAEFRESGRLIEASPQGVTREVSRVLDMDYDMFSKAVYSEQNAIDYFLRIPRGQRMEHIDRMLKLDRFEKARENAVSLSNRIKQERGEKLRLLAELRKEQLPNRISKLREELEGLMAELEKLEAERERTAKAVSELESQVSGSERDEEELNDVRRSLEGIGEGVRQIEENIKERASSFEGLDSRGISARLSLLDNAVKELEQDIDTSSSGIEQKREKVASLNAEIRLITDSLQRINVLGDRCPLCESEISGQKKRELVESRKIREDMLRGDVHGLAGEMEKSRAALKGMETELRDKIGERERYRNLARDITFMEGLESRKAEFISRKENLLARQKTLEKKLEGRDIRGLRSSLQKAVGEERELAARAGAARQRISDREELLRELRTREEMLIRYRHEGMMDQEIVEKLHGFTHVLNITQNQLREEFLKSVNQTMDRIWGELYPYGDYTGIRLAIDRDYILQLRDDGGWVNVEGMASGGERSIAALCLRVAFSMAFIPNLRWLILDEPTHNLDSSAIEHLTETLRNDRIGSFVEQVFLITHDERVSEGVGGNLYMLERNKDLNEPTRIAGLESV